MKYIKLFLLIIITVSFDARAQTTIKADDPHIHYMGRVDVQDSAAVLSWPGTSVTVNFKGSGISYKLRDEAGINYYNVILDGKIINVETEPYNQITEHNIKSLSPGTHTLELFKRTEWAMGKTWFYGFTIDNGGSVLAAPKTHKRKLEFFGNSISCGYAVEDSTGHDRGSAPYENGYKSYAALTAKHFNADFHNISRSGIGVTVSWYPLIMPEMYDRLDPTNPDSKWDFSKYTPDIVVINLFQNDSWIVNLPDNPQFKARFGDKPPAADFIIKAYYKFLKTLRSKYPKAHIICILGSMDATKPGSPWPGYIEKATANMHDKNIYTHFIPYKNTPGHPNAKEQQAMADNLEAFIEANIKW